MKETDTQDQSQTGAFSVSAFQPEDAEGVVRLFHAVYGTHYPNPFFYDAQAIIKANADKSYQSIVARSASGDVIGSGHLYCSSPNKTLYEYGAGLVLKEYRNAGVAQAMTDFLHHEFIPRNPHIEELFGEPVCSHLHMQKAGHVYNYVEAGLEVALMPGNADSKEGDAPSRVATLACFRCAQSKPHRVYLPRAYEQELRTIYGRLDDVRDLALSEVDVPGDSATAIDMTVYDSAQVARTAVNAIGADFREGFLAKEKEAMDRKTEVFQVWLDLTQPHVGEAVEVLRKAGYFFGGLLPRWLDADALLLQKVLCPPYFEQIQLYSDTAKGLLEIIKKDWRRAAGC